MKKFEEYIKHNTNEYKQLEYKKWRETEELSLRGGGLLEKCVERLFHEVPAELLQLDEVGDGLASITGLSWSRRSEGEDPPIPRGAAFNQWWDVSFHPAKSTVDFPPRWCQAFISI